MPPKNKKQKVNPSILHDLHSAIASTKPSLLSSPNLPAQLLSRAYGLAPPLKTTPGGEQLLRDCTNRWDGSQNGQAEAGSSKDGDGKVKSSGGDDQPEVIVLDSADEDEKPLKSKGKGKGKGKAKDDELKPKPCSSSNCEKNPRCLNWLGQEKWEEDSTYIPFSSTPQSLLTVVDAQSKPSRTSEKRQVSSLTRKTTANPISPSAYKYVELPRRLL